MLASEYSASVVMTESVKTESLSVGIGVGSIVAVGDGAGVIAAATVAAGVAVGAGACAYVLGITNVSSAANAVKAASASAYATVQTCFFIFITSCCRPIRSAGKFSSGKHYTICGRLMELVSIDKIPCNDKINISFKKKGEIGNDCCKGFGENSLNTIFSA